ALRSDRPMSLTSTAQPAPDRHAEAPTVQRVGRCVRRAEARDTNATRCFGPERAMDTDVRAGLEKAGALRAGRSKEAREPVADRAQVRRPVEKPLQGCECSACARM